MFGIVMRLALIVIFAAIAGVIALTFYKLSAARRKATDEFDRLFSDAGIKVTEGVPKSDLFTRRETTNIKESETEKLKEFVGILRQGGATEVYKDFEPQVGQATITYRAEVVEPSAADAMKRLKELERKAKVPKEAAVTVKFEPPKKQLVLKIWL